ncbi:MAG: HAD family hydrolase [Candidatus Woesearchaeota archaeon]
MVPEMKNLYLFDIDGTMVNMTKYHVAAYQNAYKAVLGIKVSKDVLVRQFGNVEEKIHEHVFSHYSIKDKSKIKSIISNYKSRIIKTFRTEKIRVLPGVKSLLARLKKEKNLLGVVTGNSKPVGEAILRKSKLKKFFSIFSYGKVLKRAGIVENAIKAAKHKSFCTVIVIGDSPFDIKAGKANRAITVAVATGRYSLKALKEERPDFAVRSLSDFPQNLCCTKYI